VQVPVFNSSLGLRITVIADPKWIVWWLPLPRLASIRIGTFRSAARALSRLRNSFPVMPGMIGHF
jgi:hypothetical protein